MSSEQLKNDEEKVALPHHEQQALCTTRLPYRQGRKLTAVKVYTVNNESPHLLVFGVPSLNLRVETKSMFSKFGRLLQFHVSTKYDAEPFTETYHALYDNIQSARVAKRMLDTKNYYGGSLHVCYAPELESIEETKQKLLKRRIDVTNRLKNLNREAVMEKQRVVEKKVEEEERMQAEKKIKLVDMSVENIIIDKRNLFSFDTGKKRNQKGKKETGVKRFKPVFIENLLENPSTSKTKECMETQEKQKNKTNINLSNHAHNSRHTTAQESIEIVDFTSTEKEILSNINEALNYNKFGNEVVKKIPNKPVNRIEFNFGFKNKLI